jgi:glycosyltransferase involved in cell wall biosynthesis
MSVSEPKIRSSIKLSPVAVRALGGEHGRKLNIVFVTLMDLPEGGGNTARLKMLSGAVAECGHQVSVLNEHGQGCAPREFLRPSGRMGAIEYRYVLGSVDRRRGVSAIGTKARAVLSLAREIRARHMRNRIDILWLNQLSFYDTYPLTRLAKQLGIHTIQSYEDERFELVTPQRSLLSKIYGIDLWLADRYCPRMADAIIVISRYLQTKYSLTAASATRVHLIPTIVDCDYWDVGPEPQTNTPTLLYAGTFSEQDEIDNLLAAFAVLRDRGRRFRVVTLGANRKPERTAEILSAIKSRGLEHEVEMRGFVGHLEVRKQVADANILLAIRRDGIWSESGLSTKLSEYLASGRAVVCTDLGDVSKYVQHAKSAMLVPKTTTVDQIVDALDHVLVSSEVRTRVGRAGREVAKTHFDIRAIKTRIDSILQSVL